MKCLITGAAGFIGSHLTDRLLSEGHEVTGVDNFLTGNKNNISHLLSHPQYTFIEHDCIKPLPESIQADVIFHFASPASPPKYQQLPVETLLINSFGTYLLLEKARSWNARFIFASTSEIYGDPLEHPQKESYWGNVNPNGPRSCYDEGKRVGEAYVATYMRHFDVDTRIVRIFNTYGPRMDIDDGRVVTNFIKQVLSKTPITIYGKGDQTRSFSYVSDLVSGICQFAFAQNCKNQVANIGNDHEINMHELLDAIFKVSGTVSDIVYKDLPQDDPQRRCPDLTKIKSLIDWTPKIALEEGILQTFNFFKNQRLQKK